MSFDVEKFVDGLHDYLGKAFGPVFARLDALEKSAGTGEGRTPMFWRGSFDPGEQYRRGDVVQKSGAMFVAMSATSDAPGSSSDWRRISEAKSS